MAKPLQKLTHHDVTEPLPWDDECTQAFLELKESLYSAPALGMPNYTKGYTFFCCDRDGCALSVLVQTHGTANRSIAYFSVVFDPVATELPGCLKAVAGIGLSIEQSAGIVMGYPLMVKVP